MLSYEELTEPERAVWNAVEAGSLVELPLGAPTADDPTTGQTWREDRQIRAQLLYKLLTCGNGPKDVRPRALNLAGARVTGMLNLEAATLVCPLSLYRCYFDQPINLREQRSSWAPRPSWCSLRRSRGTDRRFSGAAVAELTSDPVASYTTRRDSTHSPRAVGLGARP